MKGNQRSLLLAVSFLALAIGSLLACSTAQPGGMAGLAMSRESVLVSTSPQPSMPPSVTGAVDAEPAVNTEQYDSIVENAFLSAADKPLSTFSIDVDTASYTNIRRFLEAGELPPADAVRIEEMINYFDYQYPDPLAGQPFSVNTELGACPWNQDHYLLQIGLQGRRLDYSDIRPANLVLLIDTSGSMAADNKLDLIKRGLELLLGELSPNDTVAIVAYAGSAGLLLDATPASERQRILASLNRLNAGGSTAGGQGIQLAYEVAMQNLIADGNNRVILLTDGDFNVGVSSTTELVDLIQEKRRSGVYLTICGVGMGNYQDGRMEQISNAGNGNYFYIDSIEEATKVFVTDMRANLFTIAGDVKIQIDFNPAMVESYRLIGYENRVLANEDFANDARDAGELGAGHTVTAIYEIAPAANAANAVAGEPLLKVSLRYKLPGQEQSILEEHPVAFASNALRQTSDNFRFSAAVAAFGMLLRASDYIGSYGWAEVVSLASGAVGNDAHGYRQELVSLVRRAAGLSATDTD